MLCMARTPAPEAARSLGDEMTRHLLCGALAALAFTAGAGTAAQAKPNADEAAIRALEAQFAAAASAKDVDAIMKVYAPDVVVYDVVPPRQYVGAAAYRKDWQDVMAGFKGPVKFELSDLTVETSGSLAWSRSIQRVESADASGKPMAMTVRVTDIYHKTPAGWRIVHEHVSVPVDLATGKPDMESKP